MEHDMTLSRDIQHYFLINYNTYRQQCTLLQVCKLWYRLILSSDEQSDKHVAAICFDFICTVGAQRGSARFAERPIFLPLKCVQYFRSFAEPPFRILFVHKGGPFDRLRKFIMNNLRYWRSLGSIISDALQHLARLIDDENILLPNYWRDIRRSKISYDISYEDFCAVFG
jgi:hypothetical protein